MKIEDINKSTWYKTRFLKDQVPNHFTIVRTLSDSENLEWVLEKLHGRFTFVTGSTFSDSENDFLSYYQKRYAFEDPKEAVQFELTWS